MPSLQTLCTNRDFPEGQKTYAETQVKRLLAEGGTGIPGALFCIRRLWDSYDRGGHSLGRSLRSFILERVMEWLGTRDQPTTRTDVHKAKAIFAVLVAMHYDYQYINEHGWFDYRLEGPADIPVRDRTLVTAAALALDIDEIPSLTEWNYEQILTFLND